VPQSVFPIFGGREDGLLKEKQKRHDTPYKYGVAQD